MELKNKVKEEKEEESEKKVIRRQNSKEWKELDIDTQSKMGKK